MADTTERRSAARRCRELEAQQEIAFLHAIHGPASGRQAQLDRAADLQERIIAISNEHPELTKADVAAVVS